MDSELTQVLPVVRPAAFNDEIYITYDHEGDRNVVTTGSIPVYREATWGDVPAGSVQEGVPEAADAYAVGFGGPLGGGRGSVPEEDARPTSPGAGTVDHTQVLPIHHGNGAGKGPVRRAGHRVTDSGESPDGAASYRWGTDTGSGLSERATSPRVGRVRPHKHCPGCVGHGGRVHRGWSFGWRGILAVFFGWFAVDAAGWAGFPALEGITFPAYLLAVGIGGWAVVLIREAARRAYLDE